MDSMKMESDYHNSEEPKMIKKKITLIGYTSCTKHNPFLTN